MMTRLAAAILSLCLSVTIAQAEMPAPADLQFDLVEGEKVHLADYRGKVVLVVNTASKCGYAPQFTQLQDLAERYAEKGLVVLTVPSNDFKQELSSGEEAKRYCAMTFGADLPMARITKVTGAQAHPFYSWLRESRGFEPSWNFNKVLLDRDGNVVATYRAPTKPLSEAMERAIEAALAAPAHG